MDFFLLLKERNTVLFCFGLLNLITAGALLLISLIKPMDFAGANAWYKPIKFALSTAILAWSMAWYTGYLDQGNDIEVFNWTIVLTLAFEVFYITLQASRGQASHFNISSPLYSALFSIMGLLASIATFAVGYIGWKFFTSPIPELPDYYLWSIRLGILIFFVFSFQGFFMGAKLSHTVGAVDGGKGLPFLNWSRLFGDLRISHFLGMHALQILPILAWYVIKDLKLTITICILNTALAVFTLIQALNGKPLI